jgi:peptidoglycan/LPS O-acetylase OafA/YrhL
MDNEAHTPLISLPEPLAGHAARRDDIDGFRGIAVFVVVLFHFSRSLLPSGFLGVDMFFVISGFVVQQSIANSAPRPLHFC